MDIIKELVDQRNKNIIYLLQNQMEPKSIDIVNKIK